MAWQRLIIEGKEQTWVDMTQAEIDQRQAEIAKAEQERQQANDTLQAVKNQAQSAVGVGLTDLTQNQKEALLAVLLWKSGAVARDATINPLGEWVREE